MLKFRTLDVFFYKGYSIRSKFIRLLISIRYGIPFKDSYSHISLGYDDNSTFSAESSGIKIIPNSEIETKRDDVIIYRFKNLSWGKIEDFFTLVPQYLGKKYAFARYGLDAARIFTFVCFILTMLFGWISFKLFLGFVGFIGFLQLITIILRKIDKKTNDCAELSAIFLHKLRLMPFFSSKPRNEFPNSQLAKMKMMCWYDLAEIVGIWDYKTKTFKEVQNGRNSVSNFPFAISV
jgi:hypothetical protein